MNITDLKQHVENAGCKIIKSTAFSMEADCGDGLFVVKEPEARVKALVQATGMEKISSFIPLESKFKPSEISIGRFSKQGPWSKVLKLGDLDEVEYVYKDDDIRDSPVKRVQESINRIDRANKFSYLTSHDGIDPSGTIQDEVASIARLLVSKTEADMAAIAGNNVICGSKNLVRKSWTKAENERFRFFIKVNCKIPAILDPVAEKIENTGNWKTMTESDRFYVKSIVPPSKDAFLTGIKVLSPIGKNLLEFEVIDDAVVKSKDFFKNMKSLREEYPAIPVNDDPLDIDAANRDHAI